MLRTNIVRIVRTDASCGVETSAGAWRYLDYLDEGYKRNPVVFACMTRIRSGLNLLEWDISDGGKIVPTDSTPAQFQPIRKLLVKPNNHQSHRDFVGVWSDMMHLAGVSYFRFFGAGLEDFNGSARAKTQPNMYAVQPNRVKVKHNEYFITGFEYQRDCGKELLTPDELLYMKFSDPGDPFMGYSPMGAASYSIDSNNTALLWNLNLLRKAGVPAGVLMLMGARNMSKEDRREHERDFESRYMGAENAGAVVVLNGERAQYQSLSHSPAEMSWSEGKKESMREICAVLEVPSVLIGDPASSTYNNVESAKEDFYINKIVPLAELYAEELTNYLRTAYRMPNLEIIPNTSAIAELAANEKEIIDSIEDATFMTLNEKRLYWNNKVNGLILEPHPSPEADDLFIPLSRKNFAGKAEVTAETDSDSDSDSETKTREAAKRFDPRSLYPNEASRIRALDANEILEKREAAAMERAIKRYFNGQRRRVLGNLNLSTIGKEKILLTPGWSERIDAGDILNEQLELEFYSNEVEAVQRSAIKTFGTWTLQELSGALRPITELEELPEQITGEFPFDSSGKLPKDFISDFKKFDIERPPIKKFLADDLAQRSRLINDTTAKEIKKILEQNIGVDSHEVARKINAKFTNYTEARARTIARTETGRANAKATQEGFRQAEQKLGLNHGDISEEWIASGDNKVRDAHKEMDGQVIGEMGIPENYVFDGLAPNGQRATVVTPAPFMSGIGWFDVNCRCRVSPLPPGEFFGGF